MSGLTDRRTRLAASIVTWKASLVKIQATYDDLAEKSVNEYRFTDDMESTQMAIRVKLEALGREIDRLEKKIDAGELKLENQGVIRLNCRRYVT